MGWCFRCSKPVPDDELVPHCEQEHGEELERWPDGEVVIDTSEVLDPDDFRDGPHA